MNKLTKLLLLWVAALMALPVSAQQRRISGTVSDEIDVIIGANYLGGEDFLTYILWHI